jgi:hypothetical protein
MCVYQHIQLEHNRYFQMQRHKAEGNALGGWVSSIRSAWDRNPSLFRIILNQRPYDVVASASSQTEVRAVLLMQRIAKSALTHRYGIVVRVCGFAVWGLGFGLLLAK